MNKSSLIHKNKQPCYKCQNREVGCHSTCEKYIEWRSLLDEARAEEKARKAEGMIGYSSKHLKNIQELRNKERRI